MSFKVYSGGKRNIINIGSIHLDKINQSLMKSERELF